MQTLDLTLLRLRKLKHAAMNGRLGLALSGTAEAIEHQHLSDLRPQRVLDVGGNTGQFSLLASRLWPDARIDLFEPLEDLTATAQRYLPANVTLHPTAVGASVEDAVTFHRSASSDNSSLLPTTGLHESTTPGARVTDTVIVQMTTLDEQFESQVLERPALLKIDVQGAELDVLRGAEHMLRSIDHVYLEVSFADLYEGSAQAPEIFAHLTEAGFELAGLWNPHRDGGRILQADALFSRRKPT